MNPISAARSSGRGSLSGRLIWKSATHRSVERKVDQPGIPVTFVRVGTMTEFIDRDIWRMTLTFECINDARNIVLYVMGKNKAAMVKEVLLGPYEPDNLPVQRIGTRAHKALWILDSAAAETLITAQNHGF